MQKISIKHISNEHNDWLRALDFYKQEIRTLKGRLTEIAGKNTGQEAAAGIEHYENQFAIQSANIDELAHKVRENVHGISVQAGPMHPYVDVSLAAQHDALRDEYAAEEKTINELRHAFNRFAAVWM